MKTISLFLLILCSSNSSLASYIYQPEFRRSGASYLDKLSQTPNENISRLTAAEKQACEDRYQPLLRDGVLDIRIAMGYLDWTTGSNVNYDGYNYGYSPSIDLGSYAAIRTLLKSACYGNLQFCGFQNDRNNPYVFRKSVRLRGQNISVRVEVQFSSATESLNANLGRNNYEQAQRTAATESFFLRGLQSADAVFYFGHARNGGGPDFAPPIFVPGKNKVDYNGYYLVNHPGFKKMVRALSTQSKAPVVGILACNSRVHFLSRLREIAPDSGIITTLDVTTVDEPYTAILAASDSLMRGKCQKSFYQSLRMTARNAQFITMDGMFE